jgi:bacteriorhodopsin
VNADGSTAPAAAAAMTPMPAWVAAPAPAHSFAASVLRVFLWLALMSGLVWLGFYIVWKLRRIRAANAAHYSFERN